MQILRHLSIPVPSAPGNDNNLNSVTDLGSAATSAVPHKKKSLKMGTAAELGIFLRKNVGNLEGNFYDALGHVDAGWTWRTIKFVYVVLVFR